MRRKGAACDTAHCIVPPAGVIENPSAALQNVVVALLSGSARVGMHVAGDTHVIGRSAQAQHLGVKPDGNIQFVRAGKKHQGVAF